MRSDGFGEKQGHFKMKLARVKKGPLQEFSGVDKPII
jgi:hypothetical protein